MKEKLKKFLFILSILILIIFTFLAASPIIYSVDYQCVEVLSRETVDMKKSELIAMIRIFIPIILLSIYLIIYTAKSKNKAKILLWLLIVFLFGTGLYNIIAKYNETKQIERQVEKYEKLLKYEK